MGRHATPPTANSWSWSVQSSSRYRARKLDRVVLHATSDGTDAAASHGRTRGTSARASWPNCASPRSFRPAPPSASASPVGLRLLSPPPPPPPPPPLPASSVSPVG